MKHKADKAKCLRPTKKRAYQGQNAGNRPLNIFWLDKKYLVPTRVLTRPWEFFVLIKMRWLKNLRITIVNILDNINWSLTVVLPDRSNNGRFLRLTLIRTSSGRSLRWSLLRFAGSVPPSSHPSSISSKCGKMALLQFNFTNQIVTRLYQKS